MGESKRVFKIPAGNLGLLQARIADLAKRSEKVAKKGALVDYTPIGLIVGEKVVEPRKDEITGLALPPRVYFLCEVTGMAPKLAGWTFVATLQHEEGGTILRTVPTVELPEGALKPYRKALPQCDHCKAKRRRNDTFVVRHDDGTIKQVGRNCLADFTGCKSPQTIAAMAQFLATASGLAEEFEGWSEGKGEIIENAVDYLAFVAMAIRTSGWMSRTKAREQDEFGQQATANVAWGMMHPSPNQKLILPTEADNALAAKALAWTDAKLTEGADTDTLSDYEHNLHVAVSGGVVSFRLAGILASLVPYYERAVGAELAKNKAVSAGWVGTVGKRETFKLTLVQVFSRESDWGVQHIHKFLTDEGAVVIWKTTSDKYEPGVYEVKGTVKAHDEFRGAPQTTITRCALKHSNGKAA
jgi:hypothetical protein